MTKIPDSSPESSNEKPQLDDLISSVYEVAVDASRYESLRDAWEKFGAAQLEGTDKFSNVPLNIQEHFDRAMTVMHQMDYSTPHDDMNALIAPFGNVAALVISADMKIAAMNHAAVSNLQVKLGSQLSQLPIDPSDKGVLPHQAKRMIADKDALPSLYRVRSSQKDNFLLFQMRRSQLKNGSTVVIAVSSDLHWPSGFQHVLRDAFSLSSAEAEVVRLLIDCSSVKEIAETRGRSIDTVRAQIKAILAKTETNSQVELVRLVLSMMDIAASTIGDTIDKLEMSVGYATLATVPYHTIYDETDRRIDYLILGDTKGKPVLYVTAEYGYIRWTAKAEAEAAKRGMKVIVPIRAGYGHTDLLEPKQDFCEGLAKDIIAILDHENITSLPSVSISDDHNYPIQVEKMRPGTIRAIIGAPGGLPFTHEDQVYRMHKWYRFIQACARNTPSMLPYMLKMGFHLVKRVGKKSFLETIYEDSPADLEAAHDPEIFEALDVGSEVAMRDYTRTCETFARQTIFEQDPALVQHVHWARDKMPVHFFCGLQDPSQPPETLAEQRAEFDWIDYKIYPDAGQLLLFTKWRDILDQIEEYI